MASEVDICNLALGHIGDEASVAAINPPDSSAQAEHCARFYPIARDRLLAGHAWSFATKRIALAELSTDELPATWAYAYSLPADCVTPISILLPVIASSQIPVSQFSSYPPIPNTPDDNATQDFIVEALQTGEQVIYTNVANAELRYIYRCIDTTKFGPLVVDALARLLASYLAGPVIKGTAGMEVSKAHLSQYIKVDLPAAQAADARARKQNLYKDFIPEGLRARL